MSKCLIDGCTGNSVSRGLCRACYRSAVRMVKISNVTWDELVSLGLAKERTDIRGNGPFRKALIAAKDGDGVRIPDGMSLDEVQAIVTEHDNLPAELTGPAAEVAPPCDPDCDGDEDFLDPLRGQDAEFPPTAAKMRELRRRTPPRPTVNGIGAMHPEPTDQPEDFNRFGTNGPPMSEEVRAKVNAHAEKMGISPTEPPEDATIYQDDAFGPAEYSVGVDPGDPSGSHSAEVKITRDPVDEKFLINKLTPEILAEKTYPPITARYPDESDPDYAFRIRKGYGVSNVEQIPEGEPLDLHDSRPGLYETDADYIRRMLSRAQYGYEEGRVIPTDPLMAEPLGEVKVEKVMVDTQFEMPPTSRPQTVFTAVDNPHGPQSNRGTSRATPPATPPKDAPAARPWDSPPNRPE